MRHSQAPPAKELLGLAHVVPTTGIPAKAILSQPVNGGTTYIQPSRKLTLGGRFLCSFWFSFTCHWLLTFKSLRGHKETRAGAPACPPRPGEGPAALGTTLVCILRPARLAPSTVVHPPLTTRTHGA